MIYFDNAATTYPKPDAVKRRMIYAMNELGGNPGRSSHRLSMLADREVYSCRKAAAELFGAMPENVIFTYNATYALNFAIKSAYRGGGILISDLEHNSVRRPSLALTEDVRIFDSHLELSGEERTDAILDSIRSKLSGVDILCCTAVSNVCGARLPIKEIGELCHENGIFFIVDGAQAGGTIDIKMYRDNISALCLPGHKGLYGPQGSGMLILGSGVTLPSFIHGGSGINSLDTSMPETSPERYEGGTLSVPCIAGLRAGINFVASKGVKALYEHELKLANRFRDGLSELGNRVRLFGSTEPSTMALFKLRSRDTEEAARLLDEMGLCVRPGYHCAPLAHNRLSTGLGGAIRASFSAFNTEREVDSAIELIRHICH